ncbi:DUF2281 domain-containing protein [Nostoc linckia]|nr:DUF2281 domain-containing protein [Nostoc linckia]MBD2648420.1 DUF2281 domain-containing protein [Nostoc foliaceum FACHB-393]
MDSLKEKILEKLEHLPENAQQEVLDFVEFLEWRKENRQESQLSVLSEESDAGWLETDLSNLGNYEPYDWRPGELDKGVPVKCVPGNSYFNSDIELEENQFGHHLLDKQSGVLE